MRKRYHKDILSSPVLMLNFCPNLLSEPLELQKATREIMFLVDRSGSMSGTKIQGVKVRCRQDIKKKLLINQSFIDLSMYIDLVISSLSCLVSTGSHGGCIEESPFWHQAQYCGLRHHHQAFIFLQQALH